MAAADARKADGASLYALLTPRPPIWTGNVAWVHCESLRSTFRIFDKPLRSTLSKVDSNGLPAHGEVLKIYMSLGMAKAFLRRHKASCAGSRDRHSTDRSRLVILTIKALSTALPSRIGASSNVRSSLATLLKSLKRKFVNLIKVVSNDFVLMRVQDQASCGKGVYDVLDIIGYR